MRNSLGVVSPGVSLCMIVKNEEHNLQACLDSVRDVASELIVIDTGSTDATEQIAARNGAKWIPFDFSFVDFSAARNHAIGHAAGKWILVLDADETLSAASGSFIETFVARNENAGYYAARCNHSAEPEISTTDYAVRLFPNRPDYRYRGRVHETIDAAILSGGGRLHRSGLAIEHKFSADRDARRRKNHWYIGILREEIAANPGDDTRLDFLAAEYHQLGMFDDAAEVAEWIVQARPLDPRAHLNAGVYHLIYKSDAAGARVHFGEALRLRPGYPEAEAFLRRIDDDKIQG